MRIESNEQYVKHMTLLNYSLSSGMQLTATGHDKQPYSAFVSALGEKICEYTEYDSQLVDIVIVAHAYTIAKLLHHMASCYSYHMEGWQYFFTIDDISYRVKEFELSELISTDTCSLQLNVSLEAIVTKGVK